MLPQKILHFADQALDFGLSLDMLGDVAPCKDETKTVQELHEPLKVFLVFCPFEFCPQPTEELNVICNERPLRWFNPI
ncbi:hypothetical protein GHA01_29880 [Novacetimonas hansenii]|uniref:Uncharacterized protein n=1 Tax=Novacetimonas hansenii TaxID=436 RepID=A0ABQ0SIP2_NOVHA|nr:hypothetical protein Gaha_0101_007 [Novacetimonas hansenii JCM 7643]GEC65139.1 hypothetical protein GHA01_29880 [Novacetimonas hansenii]